VRILHFADLHLDRSFASLGMASSEAVKRREELRATLRRIVDLAIERDVQVVTAGGDLYERARPVLVAPGNHDPYTPNSLYRRVEWPDNVHVFDSPQWGPVPVAEGVTVWGAGHIGPETREDLLARLHVDCKDTAVALLHGSNTSFVPEGKVAHCPFSAEEVEATGATFLLLGHYHQARLSPAGRPRCAYPGSPEPLGFDETGPHYVLVLDICDAEAAPELVSINETFYESHEVDVSGMNTSDQVRDAILSLPIRQHASGTLVRVVLTGQPEPELDTDIAALMAATAQHFRYLDIVDRSEPAFDLDAIRGETTTRGAFVRMMEERIAAASEPDRSILAKALTYGLQAFEGREVRRR
jgi:DNA repair exonuclease SbcCD nuclease subunit